MMQAAVKKVSLAWRHSTLALNNALLFAFLLIASDSLAEDFNPFDGPNPIAVLIQSDPWAMVMDADTPRIVIYEGGEVIFLKKVKGVFIYHHVTLDNAGLAAFRQKTQPVTSLKTLKAAYDIKPHVTDQPEAMFYLRDDTREITTSVYGLKSAGTKLPAWTPQSGSPKAKVPPNELLELHKWLCTFGAPKSKIWTPKYVEVMLWDYSYAPEPSIQWPKDWPSLTSARAIKRQGAYSIFLDGNLLPKLIKFLATRKEKGAIELDGKKWAVSYRLTFPSEPAWRNAFSKADMK